MYGWQGGQQNTRENIMSTLTEVRQAKKFGLTYYVVIFRGVEVGSFMSKNGAYDKCNQLLAKSVKIKNGLYL